MNILLCSPIILYNFILIYEIMGKRKSLECVVKLVKDRYVVLYIKQDGKEKTIYTKLYGNKTTFSNGQFNSKYGSDYHEMNTILQTQKNKINNLIQEAYSKNTNSVEYVVNALDKEKVNNDTIIINENSPIAQSFQIYIEQKRIKLINTISKRTFERYQSVSRRIAMFDSKTKLNQLNIKWVNDFITWLATEKEVEIHVVDEKYERNYTAKKKLQAGNTTIKRILDDLITFLKTVEKTTKLDFPFVDIKLISKGLNTNSDDNRNIVSMSLDELKAFRAIRSSLKFDWQINTYNAYMVGVLTGLRHCDISILSTAYINNEDEIVLENTKTKFYVNIPVRDELREIFTYYNNSLVGKIPTIQRLNINLRKILSKIEIFQRKDITYEYSLKYRKVNEVFRWEKFTFHTSRKTFISLAVKNNATYDQIKRWIGWQDFRTINFYMESQRSNVNDRNVLNF